MSSRAENSRVISARIKGENLSLFNMLGLTPNEIFNYGLRKYSEEGNPEKMIILSRIETLTKEIDEHEFELNNKKLALESLQKELQVLDNVHE